ncbi:MAG: LPS export ABC transporter permease LptF [Thermodesulfobacteriota bacterium]
MAFSKIINVYIFKEMIPHFTTSLLVFTFLVLAGRILKLTEWMVNHGTGLVHVLLITLYTLPSVFSYTFPMSALLASMIAFSRLNEDNEITALKSSGVSLYQIMPSVTVFSVIIYLLASFTSLYIFPASNYSMAKVLFDVARSNASVGIKEGIFNDTIPDMVLYANQISSRAQMLEEVFIFDERDPDFPNTIVAQRGRIRANSEQMSLNLQLEDGTMYMVNEDLDSSNSLRFTSYNLKIALSDIVKKFSSRRKDNEEMSLSELRERIKLTEKGTLPYNRLVKEKHKRFSVPFTCLFFGLIGLPLGLMMGAKSRSYGVALSIIIFLLYYILMTATDSFGKTGKLHPILAAWLPNLILGIIMGILIWRAARQ